jgi:hypothetical protein
MTDCGHDLMWRLAGKGPCGHDVIALDNSIWPPPPGCTPATPTDCPMVLRHR